MAQLTDGVPADPAERSSDAAARWLLAQLLDWHRREDKSAWWAFYDRQAKTDDELVDDAEAIGRIRHLGAVRSEKKSVVHRYAFDAAQEYKLGVGDTPCDPRTGKSCGTIVALDDAAGTLELKRGPTMADIDHPTSLIPRGPIDTAVMRDALRRLAAWVIANGVDEQGSYRACRDLLLRLSPRLIASPHSATLVGAAEDPVEAAMRIVRSLDHSILPVQGPPGAGKTYTGAQIIVDQVRRGHRVGVCATTHRAIGELLTAICEVASEKATPVRILQKCDEEERCPQPSVRHTAQNAEVDEALAAHEVDVVAGTAWLFCRPELEGALDLVVIDEAGQMSLATGLGVGYCGSTISSCLAIRSSSPSRLAVSIRPERRSPHSSTSSPARKLWRRTRASSSRRHGGCTPTCARSSRRPSTTGGSCRIPAARANASMAPGSSPGQVYDWRPSRTSATGRGLRRRSPPPAPSLTTCSGPPGRMRAAIRVHCNPTTSSWSRPTTSMSASCARLCPLGYESGPWTSSRAKRRLWPSMRWRPPPPRTYRATLSFSSAVIASTSRYLAPARWRSQFARRFSSKPAVALPSSSGW